MSDAAAVLVLEDDEDTLSYLREVLSDAGVHVHAVTRAEQAMRVLQQVRVELILADELLPDMKGHAFLSWAGAQPHLSSVPRLLMSASKLPPSPAVVSTLRKPFSNEELLHLLRMHAPGLMP